MSRASGAFCPASTWSACLASSLRTSRRRAKSAGFRRRSWPGFRRGLWTSPTGSAAPAIRDRRPPVTPECLRPQPHARRSLSPLVLGAIDERNGPSHEVGIETVRVELVHRTILLDIGLEHSVELWV